MSLTKFALGSAVLLAFSFGASTVGAATWADGRTTPSVAEIMSVDPTGEPAWIYGFEDIADDGDTFEPAEQSLDIRTAYGAADATRFWFRSYVSSESAVGDGVTVFVFIDSDRAAGTGGNADETVDPAFVEDPTLGGYEFAFAVRGDETIVGIWTWNQADSVWELDVDIPPNEATGEADRDVDPILLGADVHGYLQASINANLVGITPECNSLIYIRSVNADDPDLSDLDVGFAIPCIPDDGDANGIPDIIVPDEGCLTDDECPFGGICVDGTCILTAACVDDADCGADEVCDGGYCVAGPGGSCSTNDECDVLVCFDGTCDACTPGGDDCGDGRRCGPDGRCVIDEGGGVTIDPGDIVRGGPCACEVAGDSTGWPEAPLFLSLGAVVAVLRTARRRGKR
ncbi:MAG: hypothetical protein HOW73_07950 [Polyangiaceae bacterium]|nr:hypothetical protein [Polyangiaceae bacterium]